jgi:hypothetical protein
VKTSPKTVRANLTRSLKCYAQREYGVTGTELDAFVKRTDAEIQRDRKARRTRRFTGNLGAALRD